MATKLDRLTLNNSFKDGQRPTGDDFAGAWMSFLNQHDDQISYNGTNNNIELGPNTGLVLGNPTAGVTAGTLRFNGSTIQFFDGTGFKDIAGGAGAFVQVGTSTAVAFGNGNVGIGTFASASPPTHLLEIPLGDNSVSGQQVLLGNLIIHNGSSASLPGAGAYIVNNEFLTKNAAGYALFQDSNGATTINASGAANSFLSLAIDNSPQFTIDRQGNMTLSPTLGIFIGRNVTMGTPATGCSLTITGSSPIGTGSPALTALTLNGDTRDPNTNTVLPTLIVNGLAEKIGSTTWAPAPASDTRIKKDVKAYEEGLDKVIQLKPVTYKFNGKGGSFDDGINYIGLIAQDVQKAAPEMVYSKLLKLNPEDEKETELLNYDFHNVLFMFINAFKELNTRVAKLEKPKTNEKRKTGNSPGTDH